MWILLGVLRNWLLGRAGDISNYYYYYYSRQLAGDIAIIMGPVNVMMIVNFFFAACTKDWRPGQLE